jgi:hypothetical protein
VHAGRAALAAGVMASLLTATAAGQSAPPRLEPPPDPDERDPSLFVEAHLGAVVPLERRDICPGGSSCVLGGGGVAGVEVERRWAVGIGVLLAYDVWFVESGGVFELGLVQAIRAGLRYTFLPDRLIHPTVHAGGGALWFGDSGLVSTLGGTIDAGAGLDFELTETIGVTFGARAWAFFTTPFVTPRDETARSSELGVNVALQLQVGISIVANPGLPPRAGTGPD